MRLVACLLIAGLLLSGNPYVTGRILFPEELTTVLSLVYSLIPPIRVGKDSRYGVGFRVGQNIDAQVLVELGPQQNTQPLGPGNNTRRQVKPIDMERIAEILKPFNITKIRSPPHSLQNNNGTL